MRSICLAALSALVSITAIAKSQNTVFAPLAIADRVAAAESTTLDLGEPKNLFDGNTETLIRTPSINPAFVRAEFTQPIQCDVIRVKLIAAKHRVSVAIADNLKDLKAKRGSYRVLLKDEISRKGDVEIPIDHKTPIGAIQVDATRLEGDDYVHFYEIQFCVPQAVESVTIERITDRRNSNSPQGRAVVDGIIKIKENTVLAFAAKATLAGGTQDVTKHVTWKPMDSGVEPFGDKPGELLVKKTGLHRIVVQYGDVEETIKVLAKRRVLRNRRADAEIMYIERLPEIDYDAPNGGQPKEGEEIIWRGHLYNWGLKDIATTYTWTLDGKKIASGEIELPAGQPSTKFVTVDLPWKWTSQRHDLTLTLDNPDDLIPANNTLTIQTNAITFGLWVEQSLWDHHHENQWQLPTKDANSFAGWGQRMAGQWNKMFKVATSKLYPDGIVERVRLGKVVIVPDFALPLAGGIPSNNPDLRDKTMDMTWGCESEKLADPDWAMPKDHWWSLDRALKAFEKQQVQNQKVDPPFWCGLGYIHEMSHARYLVDSYGFNVHTFHGPADQPRLLKVTDEKGPILGRYMPYETDRVHMNKYIGQMGGNYWKWSVFEAMCWNRIAGQRARKGNCNAPGDIGIFLQDIPKEMIFKFTDADGNPLRNAEVWVYQALGTGKDWYTKRYEDKPAIKTQLDNDGKVVFDRTLWSPDGKIVHTYGHSNGVALIRVTYEGRHYYLFQEVCDANIAYNTGHKDKVTFVRTIKLRTGEPIVEEWDIAETWESPEKSYTAR